MLICYMYLLNVSVYVFLYLCIILMFSLYADVYMCRYTHMKPHLSMYARLYIYLYIHMFYLYVDRFPRKSYHKEAHLAFLLYFQGSYDQTCINRTHLCMYISMFYTYIFMYKVYVCSVCI